MSEIPHYTALHSCGKTNLAFTTTVGAVVGVQERQERLGISSRGSSRGSAGAERKGEGGGKCDEAHFGCFVVERVDLVEKAVK